ncbi:MAG: WxcM-like domain-containing protein [Flavobacterium sp.]
MEQHQDLTKPKIIQLPKIQDPRGNLTFLQNPNQIPFEIKRTFWTYDVPGGEIRGGDASLLKKKSSLL